MFSTIRPRLISACSLCQKRYSHKLVEVELTQNVQGLGVIGDRIPVSPGQARNLLLPRRQALYVVAGKAVSVLREQMLKQRSLPEQILQTRRIRVIDGEVEDPIIALQLTETNLLESLELLPPLLFSRRLISSSTNPLLSSNANQIFGSVTESDVLLAMKEFGVTVGEGIGSFSEAINGIEKGRVKAVGTFTFSVNLPSIEKVAEVKVQVDAEQQL